MVYRTGKSVVRSAPAPPTCEPMACPAETPALHPHTRSAYAPLPSRAVPLIGGLLLLSPNLFPWYVVWLVPFLAWSLSVPWIAFTGTVVLAYTFFLQQPWAIPGWARAIEFAPLGLGAAWWLVARLPVGRWQERST